VGDRISVPCLACSRRDHPWGVSFGCGLSLALAPTERLLPGEVYGGLGSCPVHLLAGLNGGSTNHIRRSRSDGRCTSCSVENSDAPKRAGLRSDCHGTTPGFVARETGFASMSLRVRTIESVVVRNVRKCAVCTCASYAVASR